MGISYSFEGNEGAGKSLLFSLTKRLFEETTRFPVRAIREPGGTVLGEQEIRPILRNPEYKGLHAITNTLLYTAGRAESYFHQEIPFLEQNPHGILLKDRSWLSTIALQTVDGADINYIMEVQKPFMSLPDKFIIIDIPVEETVARMLAEYRREKSGREPDWRDKQSIETFSAIRSNYLNFAANNLNRCMVFDCFDDPWNKSAEIKLDAVKTLRSREGIVLNGAECSSMMIEFAGEAKTIVDRENQGIGFSPPEGDRHFKQFDIYSYRLEADMARKELGFPSKEEFQLKMHQEWQKLGIEGGGGRIERF